MIQVQEVREALARDAQVFAHIQSSDKGARFGKISMVLDDDTMIFDADDDYEDGASYYVTAREVDEIDIDEEVQA